MKLRDIVFAIAVEVANKVVLPSGSGRKGGPMRR
jgi:hypothetical protein